MQPTRPRPDVLRRTIGALRYATALCATAGIGLLACAFILIPVLGFASADIGAVGSWCLLLAAFTALVLLAAATLLRIRTGTWFFGEPDAVTRFLAGHRAGVLVTFVVVLTWIVLVVAWLNMR